jgi:hypothetical protein
MLTVGKTDARLAEEAKKGGLAADGKSVGGIEEIACGGMHTLAIDEAGNVSCPTLIMNEFAKQAGPVMGCQRRRRAWSPHRQGVQPREAWRKHSQ